jgi:hypothetical protein
MPLENKKPSLPVREDLEFSQRTGAKNLAVAAKRLAFVIKGVEDG